MFICAWCKCSNKLVSYQVLCQFCCHLFPNLWWVAHDRAWYVWRA